MKNNNETVASVADCIRHLADTLPNGVILNIAQCNFTADRIEAAHRREVAELKRLHDIHAKQAIRDFNRELFFKDKRIAELRRRLNVAEDALRTSPCGVIYQLGLVDDEGNDYCGCAVKFTEEENEKMPRVGMGDRFVVVPFEKWRKALEGAKDEGK